MFTHEGSNYEQNNKPQGKITVSRLPSPSLSYPISIPFFELVGGPHDGILSYRNEEGLFINGILITKRCDGVSLVGHLMMPEYLQVSHYGRLYGYRMCMRRRKYLYGDGI
jgi:hypothetical protein